MPDGVEPIYFFVTGFPKSGNKWGASSWRTSGS
jgi:hypothetical protein